MEEFSARMDDIAAKVEALTARMDTLSPPLPRTDSQRTPPSQIEAPTPPRPFSFASADKGFGFLNPSPTNEGGTSAAPQPFSSFSTLAQDFGLPKQSQPRTNIFTPPNPGSHGLFGPPNPASHGLFGSPNPASHGPFGSLNPAAHGKDSSSSKSSQRMNDIAAAIAADFMQLSVKHSQAISAAMIADFAELLVSTLPKATGIPSQSVTTQEIPTASFRTERSSNPPYAPYSENNPLEAGITDYYQSISCIPAYRGTSFEELRLQDYAQGRKTASAFGQSAAFGGVQQQLTNIFSVFGGGTSQPTTGGGVGAFGNPAPAATAARAFGTGAFGQPQQQDQQPASGIGAFGQPQQPQQQQSSIYGGDTTNSTFGNNNNAAFGGVQQQPAINIFSQAQPTQQTSVFGGGTSRPTTGGVGAFGNPAPAATAARAPGTGASGQPPQQQQQTVSGIGASGQQQQPQQQQPTYSTFGNNNNAELRLHDCAQGQKTAGAFGQSAVFGGVQHPLTELRISYSLVNCNNEAWIRRRLIDSKEPILFVGESKNRSLPVALAIMRESWDGIWASSLCKEETQILPDLLANAQDRSQINARISSRFKKSSPRKSVPEMRQKLSELTNALDPKSHDEVAARLSLIVDATRLKTSIQGPTRNIWFQCPWISRNDNITTTAKLLEGFISSAAAIQKSGDAVFLGLTARREYRDEYDLDNLKKVARRLGYEIFMDEWFILQAIDAGYKHESVSTTDIHELLIDFHQTFVLVKREHSEHASVKEQISTQMKKLEARRKKLDLHLCDLRTRERELSLVDEAMT
ncbi:hypothetical protein B0H14DRAFT_635359 [Mycena olivaceomarginata]|nr:hypothetical protein B0H14DRAFT_635359 [Mycena olivaceomarginata]